MSRHLNIISFTIPYPANYGGVIDVYHKLVALKKLGIKIHLHCFQYDRDPAPELEPLCESIQYYSRETGIREQFSLTPFIVRGRRSDALLRNLLTNNYPILFEGLHSCYYLDHPSLKGRQLIYRESNIEHQYYYHLFRSEKKLLSKAFFLIESLKLRHFQKVLSHATHMLVVSEKDCEYLKQEFPGLPVTYLPSFHGNNEVRSLPGSGTYAFYHGNLSVAENTLAAEFLIREVFNDMTIPLIIAGLKPPDRLRKLAAERGITLVEDAPSAKMDQLIREAHVNILITFQATGLKLKLLNTLFNGRHVLVNPAMLSGTGLYELCVIADDEDGLKAEIKRLFTLPFDESCLASRAAILSNRYSDKSNAAKLAAILFPDK